MIVLTFLAVISLPAQTNETSTQQISLYAGWESTWIIGLDYSRSIDRLPGSIWTTRLSLPVFVEGLFSGGKIETGLDSILQGAVMGWGMSTRALTGIAWSSDDLGSRISWTARTSLAPGIYRESWHIALETSWRAALLTWFRHADHVHAAFSDRYPGDSGGRAHSGPYLLSSQSTRIGISTAASPAPWQISVRGGLEQSWSLAGDQAAPPIFPLPFYAEIAGGYSW